MSNYYRSSFRIRVIDFELEAEVIDNLKFKLHVPDSVLRPEIE